MSQQVFNGLQEEALRSQGWVQVAGWFIVKILSGKAVLAALRLVDPC